MIGGFVTPSLGHTQHLMSFEMKLAPTETELIGRWEMADGRSKNDELLREMKVCADNGEVMPNIPETGRFWSAMGSALQIATNGQASAQSALTEARENMLPARK